MKEIINYKTITQVTPECIFAKICGESVKFPVTKEYLAEAYKVFKEEFDFYNRMLDELCLEQKAYEEERDALLLRLERLERRKAEQEDDPAVRRGLSTVCWEIDVVNRALIELGHKSGGIALVQNKVVDKTVKYLKLRREVEAVYNIVA